MRAITPGRSSEATRKAKSASTTRLWTSNVRLRIASRSDSCITSATRSGSLRNASRNIHRHTTMNARAFDDTDDDHHAEQQEDHVPVDAGLARAERGGTVGEPQQQHDPGATESGGHAVHPLRGDQDARPDEDHYGQ